MKQRTTRLDDLQQRGRDIGREALLLSLSNVYFGDLSISSKCFQIVTLYSREGIFKVDISKTGQLTPKQSWWINSPTVKIKKYVFLIWG